MPEKPKKPKRKSLVRSFARAHGIFTLLIFIFYVIFAIFGDFSFLARDIKNKYARAASISVSLSIISIPNKPVIISSSECLNNRATIRLKWTEAGATDYYDILRDGAMLVSGITATSFVDSVVSVGETYGYVVIAHGPMGSTASLPTTVVVNECAPDPPLPDPACQIIALDGLPIDFSAPVKTENRTPTISGITNMSGAKMRINILRAGNLVISSLTNANANGFWEYPVAPALDLGIYDFQITATDPTNPTRNITKSVQIEIMEKDAEDDGDEDEDDDKCGNDKWITLCHKPGMSAQKTKDVRHRAVGGHIRHGDYCGACEGEAGNTGGIVIPQNPDSNTGNENNANEDVPVEILTYPEKDLPLVVKVEVGNKNGVLYSAQDILVKVALIWGKAAPQKTELVYEIVNERGQVIAATAVNNRAATTLVEQIIPLPKNMEYGTYAMRLRTKVEGTHVTAQDTFEYRETPIVNLGGTITFTYSELVSGIGWFAIICIVLMLILLLILIHEYFLYSRSLRTITGKGLKENGLISTRKGVSL